MQFIRSFSKTVITEVSSRRVWDIHQVICPEYLTEYYHNIYGVELVDQLQEHGAVLYSKAQFKTFTNVGTYFCFILV